MKSKLEWYLRLCDSTRAQFRLRGNSLLVADSPAITRTRRSLLTPFDRVSAEVSVLPYHHNPAQTASIRAHQPPVPSPAAANANSPSTADHIPSHRISSQRTPTPNRLQKPIPLRQPIQAVIALGPRPHEPTQRVHLVLARVPPVLVHLADRDLHRGVVFGFDDAVRG